MHRFDRKTFFCLYLLRVQTMSQKDIEERQLVSKTSRQLSSGQEAGCQRRANGEVVAKDIDGTYSVEQYIAMLEIHLSLGFCCSYEGCIESVLTQGMLYRDHRDDCCRVKKAAKEGNGEVVAKDIDGTYSVEQYIEMIEIHCSRILTCCWTAECDAASMAKGGLHSEHRGACQILLGDTGIDPDERKKYQDFWDNNKLNEERKAAEQKKHTAREKKKFNEERKKAAQKKDAPRLRRRR
jgi:hypothetical protein